jgi:RHS repeat-associated protein
MNGRSLLAAIEEPTNSGAKDIPTLRLEWNKKEWGGGDYLKSWITPDGTTTTLERDEAGRVIRVTTAHSGKTSPIQDNNDVLLMQYDAQSQLTAITHQGKTTRFRYDALGHITESGSEQNAHYIAENKSAFDVPGHILWTVDHLGIVHKNRFDTESRLLEERLQSSTIQQFRRYRYTVSGQLIEIQDERGGKTQIEYTPQALPERITDALGRTQQTRYDIWGRRIERIDAANTSPSSAIRFAYDGAGHLQSVTTPTGATTRTEWDDFGRTIAVYSPDSGLSTRRYDSADHLIESQDAKGNQATYEYNSDGQISRQTIRSAQDAHHPGVTRWHYQDHRLVALEHPHQEEHYTYDEQGRLKSKTVVLKTEASTLPILLHTAYRYTGRGELDTITLPDGSLLEYPRNGQHQVVSILRQRLQTPWLRGLIPAQPLVTDIQRDLVDINAYRFGNGLQAQWQHTHEGVLAQTNIQSPAEQTQQSTRLEHRYIWDKIGNLLLNKEGKTHTAYAYDPLNQLIIAQSSDPSQEHSRYFYDRSGKRLLSQEGVKDETDIVSNTVQSLYEKQTNQWLKSVPTSGQTGQSTATLETQYDSTGQPTQIGEQRYTWNAPGQLTDVSIEAKPFAHYVYNHRGERIHKQINGQSTDYWYENGHLSAELNAQHRIIRQYFYLADQPIALLDTPEGIESVTPTDSCLIRLARDLKTILSIWFGHSPAMAYIHTNHLGAPEMITDAEAHPLWQAHYSAFGKATVHATPGFTFNLRLPGQFFDAETGLHYNHHRYYDPQRGQYLTPDPLGLRGGINSYAYTMNNPLAFIDPSGLILFAFDGTGNSQHPKESVDSISNVEKFRLAYNSGEAFYITGIGTTDKYMTYKGNIYNGDGYLERVNLGFDFLNGYIAKAEESTVDIDIIGFSRGATEARIWARQLVTRLKNGVYTTPDGQSKCLNLRFIGLWDTVAHLDYLSSGANAYNFNIPKAFKFAAQAVAVNEYRGGTANFDQISLFPYPGAKLPSNRIERGFIGSHGDIGGSYVTGDLSDVALMWMVQQAKSQGINFKDKTFSDNGWNIVTNPIVHDKSGNNLFPNEPIQSDRDVIYGNGQEIEQQKANIPGLTEQQGQKMISYLPTFCDTSAKTGTNPAVGTVNMAEYSAWLKKNYGLTIDYQGAGTPCQK